MTEPSSRPAASRSRQGGYLVSVFGGLIGAVIGGVLGAFATTLYADLFLAPEEKVTLLIQFARNAAASTWIGAAGGTWLGLRWRRYVGGLSTAALSAVLTLPTVGLFWRSLPAYGINPPRVAAAMLIVALITPLLSRLVVVWVGRFLRLW